MGQKITNSVPGLYDKKKKQQLIVLFNSDVIKKSIFKRVVATRFVAKIYL